MSAAPTDPAAARVRAFDVLRGLVMVLMAVDHADAVFSSAHLVTDSAALWRPGGELPPLAFLTRWSTHLCAPTFLFLVGVGAALSRRGPRDLVARGLLLMALDPLWMWWAFAPGAGVQVLFCIGACMALLPWTALRWPVAVVLPLALLLVAGGEAITFGALALDRALGAGPPSLPTALLLSGGWRGMLDGAPMSFLVVYPIVPWLAVAWLGVCFGRAYRADPRRAQRWLWSATAAALTAFVLVRGLDGYGNMGLYRDGAGVLHWLHVSKYPPSLTFVALELGVMGALLAGLLAVERRLADRGLLLRLGQAALFFYLLHAHLLLLVGTALGARHRHHTAVSWLAAGAVCVALWPACAWYRRLRARHPRSLLRLV